MQYRYRVFGKVEHSFILRGAYFAIGSEMDFYVTECELPFIKDMCKIDRIVDSITTETDNSISKAAKATKQPTKRKYNKRKESGTHV